ncbi:DUF3231 family protein [Paenibacillus sedimenti]|uniref:DUF3231 family protein n=1 Tax=Paenibacillus sedimenti TaxID=2770274 RepID=A0A926KUX6_9BACL|nr:DUF3231 family protein [Paenibacillus sedimenti]MBD0383992.1 DUF3231 family protein [Paenibacillus sedimenti]
MNIMEVFNDAIKPFLDGEKPPLNVGEVMNLWFYLAATEQSMRGEQVSFNIVQDPELKEKIKVVINDVHGPIFTDLTEFLKAEGIPLPQGTPEKPVGDFRNMPEGSKLSDEEVANLLSFNIMMGINYACRGMTEAVRPDVAAMFAKFQIKKVTYSILLKDLLMKKGWLKVPPYFKTEALQNAGH